MEKVIIHESIKEGTPSKNCSFMRKVIWERWLTKVIIEEDSSIIVDTPISIERGFKTEQDAIDYAFSWGSVDRR